MRICWYAFTRKVLNRSSWHFVPTFSEEHFLGKESIFIINLIEGTEEDGLSVSVLVSV